MSMSTASGDLWEEWEDEDMSEEDASAIGDGFVDVESDEEDEDEDEDEDSDVFGDQGLQSVVVPRDLPAPCKGDNLHAHGTTCALKYDERIRILNLCSDDGDEDGWLESNRVSWEGKTMMCYLGPRTLTSATSSPKVAFWDLEKSKLTALLQAQTGPSATVRALEWSSPTHQLAVCTSNKRATMLDPRSGKPTRVIKLEGIPNQFKFNTLSQYQFAIGMDNGHIIVADNRQTKHHLYECLGQVRSIDWSPIAAHHFMSSSRSHAYNLSFWSTEHWRMHQPPTAQCRDLGNFRRALYTPDGKGICVEVAHTPKFDSSNLELRMYGLTPTNSAPLFKSAPLVPNPIWTLKGQTSYTFTTLQSTPQEGTPKRYVVTRCERGLHIVAIPRVSTELLVEKTKGDEAIGPESADGGADALQRSDVWIRKEVTQLWSDHPGDHFAWDPSKRTCTATLQVKQWQQQLEEEREKRQRERQQTSVTDTTKGSKITGVDRADTAAEPVDGAEETGPREGRRTITVRLTVPAAYPIQRPSFKIKEVPRRFRRVQQRILSQLDKEESEDMKALDGTLKVAVRVYSEVQRLIANKALNVPERRAGAAFNASGHLITFCNPRVRMFDARTACNLHGELSPGLNLGTRPFHATCYFNKLQASRLGRIDLVKTWRLIFNAVHPAMLACIADTPEREERLRTAQADRLFRQAQLQKELQWRHGHARVRAEKQARRRARQARREVRRWVRNERARRKKQEQERRKRHQDAQRLWQGDQHQQPRLSEGLSKWTARLFSRILRPKDERPATSIASSSSSAAMISGAPLSSTPPRRRRTTSDSTNRAHSSSPVSSAAPTSRSPQPRRSRPTSQLYEPRYGPSHQFVVGSVDRAAVNTNGSGSSSSNADALSAPRISLEGGVSSDSQIALRTHVGAKSAVGGPRERNRATGAAPIAWRHEHASGASEATVSAHTRAPGGNTGGLSAGVARSHSVGRGEVEAATTPMSSQFAGANTLSSPDDTDYEPDGDGDAGDYGDDDNDDDDDGSSSSSSNSSMDSGRGYEIELLSQWACSDPNVEAEDVVKGNETVQELDDGRLRYGCVRRGEPLRGADLAVHPMCGRTVAALIGHYLRLRDIQSVTTLCCMCEAYDSATLPLGQIALSPQHLKRAMEAMVMYTNFMRLQGSWEYAEDIMFVVRQLVAWNLPKEADQLREDLRWGVNVPPVGSDGNAVTGAVALDGEHSGQPAAAEEFLNTGPAVEVCSICRMPCTSTVIACGRCGHGGHEDHMKPWFRSYANCPEPECACICSDVGQGRTADACSTTDDVTLFDFNRAFDVAVSDDDDLPEREDADKMMEQETDNTALDAWAAAMWGELGRTPPDLSDDDSDYGDDDDDDDDDDVYAGVYGDFGGD